MKHWKTLMATALASAVTSLGPAMAADTDQSAANPADTDSVTNATDSQKTGSTDKNADGKTTEAKENSVAVIALPEWHYDVLYKDGWSAEKLIEEADVYGSEGEEIGDVENILVGDKGQALALIVEMGGFIDLGDTHIMVPWDKVKISDDLERIDVPVNQDNAEEFSMYGGVSLITKPDTNNKQVVFEDVATGNRVWQITELLNDFAVFDGNIGYGYVDDAIFNQKGKLLAVVVSPDSVYGPGPYAYPYYGYAYGFAPGVPYYSLGYSESDVSELEPFDEDKMNNNNKDKKG